MKALKFKSVMNEVLLNLEYFSLMGFQCKLSVSITTDTCELVVFYDDDKYRDLIIEQSTLECFPQETKNTKWITMTFKNHE